MINHLINSSDYRESQFITNGVELINLVYDLKQKNINMLDDRELNFMAWQLLGYGEKFSIDEQINSL